MARERASLYGQQSEGECTCKMGEKYGDEPMRRKEDNEADVEADVECVRTSSRSSTEGFLMRALAMAILCFCPPLIDPPLVPTSVS